MKKTIFTSIFLILLFIFSILIIIFSIQDTNFFYERYTGYNNYINDYKDIIDISDETIQSINKNTNISYVYYLKNIFATCFASICAVISSVILFLMKPNIFNCFKNSQIHSQIHEKKLFLKEKRKAARISKLEKELEDLKKGGE